MSTPEETRERIKEMRERIFERSTDDSDKKDSKDTSQKTDSNENKVKNSKSQRAQTDEIKSKGSSEDVTQTAYQQKDEKVSTISPEIKDTGSVEKSETSTLETDTTRTIEYILAESNTKIKKVEDLVNESIVQASEIREAFTDRFEELKKTLLLKINSIEKKCSSTDEKIEKLKRVFLKRSNKPKKKYQY